METSKPLPKHLRYVEKRGGYLLDWREKNGKRRFKVLGRIPKAQALKIHAEFYSDMVNKKLGIVKRSQCSVRQAVESFLKYSENNKRSFKDDIFRAKSITAYFGDARLDELNFDSIEAYKLRRKRIFREKWGREIAVASLNRELEFLKAVANLAFKNGFTEKNSFQGLRLGNENNQRDRTLTQAEYKKLLENCSEHVKLVVMVAYTTAMRLREILKLTWDQVDLANMVVVLEQKDTKTGEAREAPLSSELVAMFRKLPRSITCNQVFLYKGKPVNGIKTGFVAACRRAQIENFRFHDLRHCAITNFRKAKVPSNVIKAISGHKTDAMFRRYDKIDREDLKEAVNQVGDFLETRRSAPEKAA